MVSSVNQWQTSKNSCPALVYEPFSTDQVHLNQNTVYPLTNTMGSVTHLERLWSLDLKRIVKYLEQEIGVAGQHSHLLQTASNSPLCIRLELNVTTMLVPLQ